MGLLHGQHNPITPPPPPDTDPSSCLIEAVMDELNRDSILSINQLSNLQIDSRTESVPTVEENSIDQDSTDEPETFGLANLSVSSF
jgi:hypothetical protein